MDVGEIIAIVAVFGIPIIFLMIPIVAILTSHQQKMARLMRERAPQNNGLEEEVRELRQLLHQQTIALDDVRKKLDSLGPRSEDVGERLRNSG